MISRETLLERIGKMPGERVTQEHILAAIVDCSYHRIDHTVTICSLRLVNGFSVRGESACVDPKNFDEKIGQRIAYDNAFAKLWPLFGFLLAEKRHIAHEIAHASDGGRAADTVDFSLAGFEVAGLNISRILQLKAFYENHTGLKATDL